MSHNTSRAVRSALTRQILVQYALTLLGASLAFLAVVGLAYLLAQSRIWYPEDPTYQLLRWVKDHLFWVCAFLLALIWLFVTLIFISRPLAYLDILIAASHRLAAPDEREIILPPAMRLVQEEMNRIREQALHNQLLAREAEQRKNDLIVYLAHDLKTPLTSVIGYLTLLRDEPQISPELRAHYTGIALDKALRLEDLINEFFDITRFNLTTLTLETERIYFSRMLEQIACEFEPILAEKGLQWENSIESDVMLSCDPNKMERVLDNLIRNAIHYSYPNTHICLQMRRMSDGVEIVVQNHGKNIPPEKLSRIFEQFYRVDASRSSQTGGAGLGLAIAKQIVEQHGGRIQAQCQDERIRFLVRLPDVRQNSV